MVRPALSLMRATLKSSTSNGLRGLISLLPQLISPKPRGPNFAYVWPEIELTLKSPRRCSVVSNIWTPRSYVQPPPAKFFWVNQEPMRGIPLRRCQKPVSYTHLRAHETPEH